MSARPAARPCAADDSSAPLFSAVNPGSALRAAVSIAAAGGLAASVMAPAAWAAPATPSVAAAAVNAAPAVRTLTTPAKTTTAFGEMRFTAKPAAQAAAGVKASHEWRRTLTAHRTRKAPTATTSREVVSTSRAQDRAPLTQDASQSQQAAPQAQAQQVTPQVQQVQQVTPQAQPQQVQQVSSAGVIGLAQQYSGIWYVYGGTTPAGFDCSGFTQYLYGKLGIYLPRTAEAQRQAVTPVSNPQVGDLVFFGAPAFHVGIYAGNGMMYDSPRTGKQSGLHAIWSSDVTYGRP